MHNNFRIRGQAGSSVVSFLVALSIITLAVFYGVTSIDQMRDMQYRAEAGGSYNQFELIIRNTVGKAMRNFQSALQKNDSCLQASKEFGKLALNTSGSVEFVRKFSKKHLPQKLFDNSTRFEPYIEAYERCQQRSFTSLKGKNNFYFCGLLSSPQRTKGLNSMGKSDKLSSFAEFQASFWDFQRGIPIKCEDMRSVSGRGMVMQYTIYFIRPTRRDLGVRHHSGRFYIPKRY